MSLMITAILNHMVYKKDCKHFTALVEWETAQYDKDHRGRWRQMTPSCMFQKTREHKEVS